MVTIVFSANEGHAMLLGIAFCSLFENKKGDYPMQIYVLDGGIAAVNKERLKILEYRYRFSITYLVPDQCWFADIVTNSRPIAAYYRIAMARLLPADCRRVLYLDCDVLVESDIAELFYAELHGKTVGAVLDNPQNERSEHLQQMLADVSPHDSVPTTVSAAAQPLPYFNSGVLLIDMDRWRELRIEEKLFAFIRAHPDKLFFDDQDPLNVILLGDWQALSARYNYVPFTETLSSDESPVVVHFSGGMKPWYFFSALPYQKDYVRYAHRTPWRLYKYRKIMDVPFAKQYHLYPVVWRIWEGYKKIKLWLRKI